MTSEKPLMANRIKETFKSTVSSRKYPLKILFEGEGDIPDPQDIAYFRQECYTATFDDAFDQSDGDDDSSVIEGYINVE